MVSELPSLDILEATRFRDDPEEEPTQDPILPTRVSRSVNPPYIKSHRVSEKQDRFQIDLDAPDRPAVPSLRAPCSGSAKTIQLSGSSLSWPGMIVQRRNVPGSRTLSADSLTRLRAGLQARCVPRGTQQHSVF